ncbi:MAG: hypothetical protein Q8M08_08005 [Bacteroidales bacterium]|nr:hypothetical protein [Bacteroidales bacterium]
MKHKGIRIRLYLVIACSVIISLISCKKSVEEPAQNKQWLMTINFTDDFINPKLKAIIFISDRNGNTLIDTLISGNPRLVLHTVKNVLPPFQVTVVKWEPDMHNFLVTINTYREVMPAEWTIKGTRLVSTGEAIVNLQNVPAHSGPILYSNLGHSNLTFSTTGSNHPVYKIPDDLYVRLNTASGPLFKWRYGLESGGVYNVDLTDMESAVTHTIHFPLPAQDFHVKVFGYRNTSEPNSLPLVTDELLGDGTKADSVRVSYPPSVFNSFRTSIEMIESWTSSSRFAYTVSGQIPDSFVKINATVSDIRDDGKSATFKTSGLYSVTTAKWKYQDLENLAFDWTVLGPDTLTTITLPSLPSTMKMMFPTLSTDSLRLYQVELIHYPVLTSWPEYLQIEFNPADPGKKSYLESSAVRTQFD